MLLLTNAVDEKDNPHPSIRKIGKKGERQERSLLTQLTHADVSIPGALIIVMMMLVFSAVGD